MMVARGNKLDYCWMEAMRSLLPVCDQFALTLFSPDDIETFRNSGLVNEPKLIVAYKTEEEFDATKGKERLNYWTNQTRNLLTTDYQFNIQADEILHEDCYPVVRALMQDPKEEAYAIRRVNLWGDPYHYLNYPKIIAEGRAGELPCSDYVVRIAKRHYDSAGDAESIGAPFSWQFKDAIRTYHMGFVRDKRKKTDHILHIQEKVFDLGYHDPRTDADIRDNEGKFRPYTRFSRTDLSPIQENLPKIIQAWAQERNK